MPRKSSKNPSPQFAMADALHLIRGDSPGGTLRHAGARFVVYVRDTLAYGPSSAEPQTHRSLRRAFWGEESGPHEPIAADELELACSAFPSHLPVIVWSGGDWSDRLFLWWALDALSRTGLVDRPLCLASPLCVPGWDFLDSMGCYNPEQMQRMFGHAQRLGSGLVKTGLGRWRRFCEKTPRGLAGLGTSRQPWLNVGADYFRFFPRRVGKTLSVSEFDAAVLSAFSPKSWHSPLELFAAERLRQHPVLLNHGDLLPLLRLDAWTTSRPLPVLRRRPSGDERGYRRHEYQLTSHGVRVLKDGLRSIGWGPALAMGGHAAYDSQRPWVTRETRGGWKLRPI